MQGLVETWRKKEEKAKGRAEQLKSFKPLRVRGDVYCVLQCEGQVKRTALAKGHLNPVWKEDIAFKSVRISSDLQVLFLVLKRAQHSAIRKKTLERPETINDLKTAC